MTVVPRCTPAERVGGVATTPEAAGLMEAREAPPTLMAGC